MRGYPPLQMIVVLAAFALLSLPLWKLTMGDQAEQPVETQPMAQTQPSESLVEASLVIRCAHAPEKLEIISSRGTIATWNSDQSWPKTISLQIVPGQPVELAVTAHWPQVTDSTAVTLEFSPHGLPSRSETRWSIGPEMDDVFTFAPVAQP